MRVIREVVLGAILYSGSLFSQSNIDVCSLPDYDCINGSTNGTLMISNLQDNGTLYTSPGSAMPFWIGKKDFTTGFIDTSLTTNVNFGTAIGPGKLRGTMSTGGFSGYTFITDWVFSKPGYYKIPAMVSGAMVDSIFLTVLPETELCDLAPSKSCQTGKGDSIYIYRNSSIVSVDAVYPITVGLIEKKTGIIDSSFAGITSLELISGPSGFKGSKVIYGSRWTQFVDITFDVDGMYNIKVTMEDTIKKVTYLDSMQVEVVPASNINSAILPEFEIFPNPASNSFSIKGVKANRLVVFDQSGRNVMNAQMTNSDVNTVSIEHLSKGSYFLQFISKEEELIGRSTLVKIK